MNLDENKVSTGFRFKGKTISKIFNPRNQTFSNYIFFVKFQLKYTKKNRKNIYLSKWIIKWIVGMIFTEWYVNSSRFLFQSKNFKHIRIAYIKI